MAFTLPTYREPDFSLPPLAAAPEARFAPAPADGVAPDGFHATSNFPEYVNLWDWGWMLVTESRMDCVVVRREGRLTATEFRNLKAGDPVLLGRTENGEDGIYLHASGFEGREESGDKFQFRTRSTRETPFSRDYDYLYELLRYERERGFIVWVLGPAVAFDRDSREAMAELVDHGYCHAVAAGNALVTHDLEAALFGTALGQDIYTKRNLPGGHYHHLELLNRARRSPSTASAVEALGPRDGIIRACTRRGVPLVLAGSIRDDGPFPGVIAGAYAAQDAMRSLARQATTVIALATQLHAVAFGNMLPSYRISAGSVRPVFFYVVDVSEFAVDKLANRGSFQASGISTNVQDFCVNLRRALIG